MLKNSDNIPSRQEILKYGEKLKNIVKKSYAPYSNFHVAAILTTETNEYTGVNIENRSYSLTICAERVAIFKAVEAGDFNFKNIFIYSPDSNAPLPPCGACRQVITEFSNSCNIIMFSKDLNYKIYKISELLPEDSLHDLKENN